MKHTLLFLLLILNMIDELKHCRKNVMIITKMNTFVAFSCLLMGMTDLHEKRIMLIERLDTTS